MAVGDGTVFINYRRDDTRWPAKTIYEELTRRIGPERVFKDVDNIELGENFVERITAAVTRCDVMLSLIGEDWLDSTDAMGRRRLDNPRDFVRLELETALQRGVRVIPILVDGAEMPPADSLPESLRPLTERQAVSISPERVEIDRLVKALTASFADSARPLVTPTTGAGTPAAPSVERPAPAAPAPQQPTPTSAGSPYQAPVPHYQQPAPAPSGPPYQPAGPSYRQVAQQPGPSYQQPGQPTARRPAPGYPPPGQPVGPQVTRTERGPNRTPWLLAVGVIVVALLAWGLNSVLNGSTPEPSPTPGPSSASPTVEPTPTAPTAPASSPAVPPAGGLWSAEDVSRFLFTRAELEAMVPDATGIYEDELSWVWTDTTASPDYCSGAIAFGPDGGVDRWRKAVASSPSGAVVSFGAAYDTAALAASAFDRLRATRCDGGTIELTSSGQPWDTVSYSELASEFGYSLTRIDFTFGSWRERACVTNANVLVCYSMAAIDANFATADGTAALTLGVERARGLVAE